LLVISEAPIGKVDVQFIWLIPQEWHVGSVSSVKIIYKNFAKFTTKRRCKGRAKYSVFNSICDKMKGGTTH